MQKLLVLDGFSLAFRAFYALPETMVTSSGQYTNAIHGFVSMLVNLTKEHEPTHIAVAFDHPDPTFRDELSTTYKGTRSKTPESLLSQFPLIEQVVRSLGICLIEKSGYEADDIIATIATMASNNKIDTVVVTGDRDSFQLVEDPYIKVLYNKRGVSDYELLDEAGVEARMGVPPVLYPEFAAMRGDPSDNIPGVPGVGQKTAAKLLIEYGSIAGIYDHLDELTPKLRETFIVSQEQMKVNLQLIPLVRDVPIEIDLEDLRLGNWEVKPARDLFRFLEFHRIWERTRSAFDKFAVETQNEQGEFDQTHVNDIEDDFEFHHVIGENIDQIRDFVGEVDEESEIYLDVEWHGIPGRSVPRSISLFYRQSESVVKVISVDIDKSGRDLIGQIFRCIAAKSLLISGVGLKEVLRYLLMHEAESFKIGLDLSVASYLLDPGFGSYDLEYLSSKWSSGGIVPTEKRQSARQLTIDINEGFDQDEASRRVRIVLSAARNISTGLNDSALRNLYLEIEKPLILVLAKMEACGILVDKEYLESLKREFIEECSQLQREIQLMADESFNVNSTQQLAKVLFEKLKLSPQKKTKTGYSTDARSLEKMVDLHPIIPKIMRYREVEKLRSTYGETLIGEIASDGRIRASFSQTVARTGRLSSDHPNLHNIPIRTQDGRRFRNAFVAPKGKIFIIADYSQIELRVIAHLSKDPGLVKAFEDGIDIHRQTASLTFGVPLSEVTPIQRNRAKMVAYGLAYGMEAYGLSQRLGISVKEADEILKAFFEGFPSVRSYMESAIERARKDGFTTTEFGRRRPIPELISSNKHTRESAERQAMNAGIQGLAADIFKIALVKLDQRLSGSDCNLVLQVHDEVLVEANKDSASDLKEEVKTILESAVSLSVPLEVNIYLGHSWGDGKD